MYVHVVETQPARSQSIAEDKSWAENACINQLDQKRGHPLSYHTRGSVLALMKMEACTVMYRAAKASVRWKGAYGPDRCPTIYM